MNPNLKDPAGNVKPDVVVTVLAISSRIEDHAALQTILAHSNWTMHQARDCRQAEEVLRKQTVGVIVCQHDLPDGNWLDIQDVVARLDGPPPVVVCSSDADERMWAEVLNLGGYDVLPKPFETAEVVRILGLAWRHWKESCRKPRPAPVRALTMAAAAAG